MDENGGQMHLLLAHGVDGDGDDVDGEVWMKMMAKCLHFFFFYIYSWHCRLGSVSTWKK
jgi:hypothetical protein